MKNLGLEILELFAEASEQYRDRQIYKAREGYVPIVKHDLSKRQWRADNKDLQRIYTMRHYYKRRGLVNKMPPIQTVKVEIFWDGDGFYYAKPLCSERLGGPFDALHKAWKSADKQHFEVIAVLTTRGQRSYR